VDQSNRATSTALNECQGVNVVDWRRNLLTNSTEIASLLEETRTIAVLGIKTEAQAGQPAFYVPSYLQTAGFQIIPVPVYYPKVTRILEQQVYRRLVDIPVDIDLVNVFRRSEDIPPHVEDILAKMPKAVWLQSGIRNDAVAETLAKAGIKVVQDRCLMVDHRWLKR
jgi:predicted CoA-binding protein